MFNHCIEIEPINQIGQPIQRKTGIILNMIVKNESPVIERLLRSVAPVIDYFVIVDTGSTDGTPEKIKQLATLLNLSGKIYFRNWVDFGFNRQEALDLVIESKRGDWVLFIDADEELVFMDPLFYQKMDIGVTYLLEKRYNSLNYFVPNLIDIHYNKWAWKDPVHEYLKHSSGPAVKQKLTSTWIKVYPGEGHRSKQKDKFEKDIQLIKTALEKDPQNARLQFYLAQSYRDAGLFDRAILEYETRVSLGGWYEEGYIAQIEKTKLMEKKDNPPSHDEIILSYLKAYSMCITRAEALYYLSSYCRRNNLFPQGYLFAKMGLTIPYPIKEILFIQKNVYDWELLDEFSICAYYVGQFQESADACERLLQERLFFLYEEERIVQNHKFARAKL